MQDMFTSNFDIRHRKPRPQGVIGRGLNFDKGAYRLNKKIYMISIRQSDVALNTLPTISTPGNTATGVALRLDLLLTARVIEMNKGCLLLFREHAPLSPVCSQNGPFEGTDERLVMLTFYSSSGNRSKRQRVSR